MQYLIILAIFLIPIASIITIKGTIVWFPQLLALEMIGGICYASMFWKLNKFLSIFIAYLFFSYIYVTGASERPLMCLLIGSMAIAVTLVTSKLKELKWIYVALIIMSLLSILYAILQTIGIDPIFKSTGSKWDGVVSFMGSHNQLGIYSVANAFWCTWLIPLAIISIFLVKCNSALIGIIFGSCVYSYFKFNKKVLKDLLIIGVLLLIPWWHYNHKGNGEISERFRLWKLTLQQINSGKIEESDMNGKKSLVQANPFFGFGLGNFLTYSPFSQYRIWGLNNTDIYRPGHPEGIQHFYEHVHNDLLEALYEFGYIGFIIIILTIGSVVFTFVTSVKSVGVITTFSSLVAQSFTSFSVYVFHAPVSLFMFCLTLGLFYAEVSNGQKSSEIKPITT